MTTLERNADIVHMATYAPLFAHVEGWQWRPDLIWFDNLASFRSCSWYVQKLYSQYKGTCNLSLTDLSGKNVTGAEGQNGLFASSVYDAENGQIYVKVINVSDHEQPISITFDGLKKNEALKGMTAVSYHSDDLDADNTLDEPEKIVPVEVPLDFEGRNLEATVAPKTFMVYVLQK
jgi:alpha-L-arabinofuranosidase